MKLFQPVAWPHLGVSVCPLLPRWDVAFSDVGTESATKTPLSPPPPPPLRHDSGRGEGDDVSFWKSLELEVTWKPTFESPRWKKGAPLLPIGLLRRGFFAWQFEPNSVWSRCVIFPPHNWKTQLWWSPVKIITYALQRAQEIVCAEHKHSRRDVKSPSVWNISPFSFVFAEVLRMFRFRFAILSISELHLTGRSLSSVRHLRERSAG